MGFFSKFFNKDEKDEEAKGSVDDKTASFTVNLSSQKPIDEETKDEIDLPGETATEETDIDKDKDIDINV